MSKTYFWFLIFVFGVAGLKAQSINFVFVSDLHYGIMRSHFRGEDSVPSFKVNAAMVDVIKSLRDMVFPNDSALEAGKSIKINDIVVTGDIANREELSIQSAAASWVQFQEDYMHKISYPLLLVPGNHDVSNAIGYTKPMQPLHDATSLASIYDLMENKHVAPENYDYVKEKVNYSRDMDGVHMMFVNIWPDSANRIWMEKDLAKVEKGTPVIIFTHDPPEGDPKHFTNPFGTHTINSNDKFENLLDEHYKDKAEKSTDMEQEGFIAFLKKHPNIKAYFHGHSNFCEMYDYKGVKGDVSIPTFRADSPMKGEFSKKDEQLLSLQIITINAKKHKLVSRELFWNLPNGAKKWGMKRTIAL